MLEGRQHHEIAVIDGEIYAIGGEKNNEFLYTMEIFNIQNNKWTAAPSMTENRSQFSAVALGGYICAIGGINNNQRISAAEIFNRPQFSDFSMGGNISSHLNSVERFDVKTKTWASLASLPEGRFGHRAVAYNEKIVCVGGNHSSVLEYNPDTDYFETTFQF
ncbi:uncharacterized protein LOC143913853 [Arctopsyche grandis]|uniref:uncharacterized protein LOC143913853 n=1 Tax=Arctopsyche grandis TaxID=121162 RepID=UPI00406D6BD0